VLAGDIEYVPNGQSKVEPTPLVFPFTRWYGVETEQNISLTHLHILVPADECSTGSQLSVAHDLRIKIRTLGIEPRSNRTN